MKQFFLFLTALFFCVVCQAQQYKVYSVVGTVKTNGKHIQRGMLIKENCPITISENSKIIVLNENAKEMITLSTPTSGQLKDIIGATPNRKKLSDSYFQYVLKKMTEDDSPRDKNIMQSAATSYRDADSVMMNICCPEEDSKELLEEE